MNVAQEEKEKGGVRASGWFLTGMIVLCAVLRFCLFPPISLAEAAYVFLVPLLLVDWSSASKRRVFLLGWLSAFLFWTASLIWLRHVTVAGTLGLSGILAVFFGIWLVAFAKLIRPSGRWWISLAAASLWVVLEWVRSWIFWGFPWNPVSVSQWNRPAVLSLVSVTGGWGLSFLLVWLNVALAEWLVRPFTEWKRKGFLPFARRVPLMVVLPLGILMVSAGWFFFTINDREPSQPIRVGFVQPYLSMKWDREQVSANLDTLWEETLAVGDDEPDLILWPESSTPLPIVGNDGLRIGVERLATRIGAPILMGNMAFYREDEYYENGVFYVDPEDGLAEEYYAKRELVPFGEFIPFRQFLPFLETVVPIGLDCRPGDRPVLFPFPVEGQTNEQIGALVCYEDVFPGLARSTAAAGADWLFVATNNVWYGEEAGAYQHAVHAVLRAVETRRPILRSGNGGWSGWIDEWGRVRSVVENEEGTIYFRGGEVIPVERELRFAGYQTPFVRWGDWFVGLSAVVLLASIIRLLSTRQNNQPQ
ncbi:MAG: apolipoprotein N-acyltransferase [Verrucomicrobiota bacterium]